MAHKPRGLRASLAAVVCSLAAAGTAQAWQIDSFETVVELRKDATATVTETIVADFRGESKHGIFRDIPVHYADRAGQHFRLRLRVQDVTGGQGRPQPYRLEAAGRYQRLRIGDPDRTVTGEQTYRIVYEVQRGAVRFFPDHDECYWNLTGNEWAVPMRRVRAEIHLPAAADGVRAVAYQGGYGSTALATALEVVGSRIIIEPSQAFRPYEGLTAAVAWAKGATRPPSTWRVLRWWLEDNWVYGIPLAVAAVMTWLWRRRGREPLTGRSLVVQYESPDGLTPAEAGTLWDQRVHLRDITSTLVDLAVRGYLRIEPQTGWLGLFRDHRLVSLKSWAHDRNLKPHEVELLEGLFGGYSPEDTRLLSELSGGFARHLGKIRDHLYRDLVLRHYFDSDPDMVRIGYLVGGGLTAMGIVFGLIVTQFWHHLPTAPLIVASLLSGGIIAAFSQAMPRRTLKGAHATDQLAGFREFLSRTDQDRIRRMNDPTLFERCLPYALAFGVAELWARAFEGLYAQPPAWYAGQWDAFSPTRFERDLSRSTTSMGQAFAATPGGSSSSFGGSGFGGGGFSGGGGGGGGGGSW